MCWLHVRICISCKHTVWHLTTVLRFACRMRLACLLEVFSCLHNHGSFSGVTDCFMTKSLRLRLEEGWDRAEQLLSCYTTQFAAVLFVRWYPVIKR